MVAGFLGWLIGPSTAVFRAATTLFGVASLGVVYAFTRYAANNRAALLAVIALATAPIFYIYSHLMMLEVPLLFGVTIALLGYYYYLSAAIVRWPTILLVSLTFAIGVQGKVIGIAVIFLTLGLYGLSLLLAARRSSQFSRFFAWPTLLFAVVAILSWYAYIWLVRHYLHADMLGFFLDQSKEQAGSPLGPLGSFARTVWHNKDFYRRDFLHYPFVAALWLISLAGYLAWRRSLLATFLFLFGLANWILFSGVLPQVPQYILPIFTPLAIATGLMMSDLIDQFVPKPARLTVFALAAAGLGVLQVSVISKSETYGWREQVSRQGEVASYLTERATPTDRVLVWSDGTIYAVRLAGYAKKLAIINGNHAEYSQLTGVRAEWAVVEPDRDQGHRLQQLTGSGWNQVFERSVSGGVIYVLQSNGSAHSADGQ
jgi:4-amino-4-deoxy-L-arabinose transferase-like glycosyltransferase